MAVDELDPSPLMLLDTPILKVSRPVAACSRCRNAKIKCDGKLPACSSCEKNGRAAECTSTNDQFARGKERSYVSTLETRIERLKERLEEARARKPSVTDVPEDDAPTRPPPHPPQAPTSNSTKAMRRREVMAIDDLVNDFGILSVNATARDFYGFTSAMSYARLILAASSKEALPEGMAQPLPARYQTTSLVQHYLDNVFMLLPVFDEASFYASVENVYSTHVHQADPHDHFMVRMVLAISSASSSEQRGDQRYVEAIGHVCEALKHSEHVLHPGQIASIQALVLLTEFAMLDPRHFDAWGLIGAASRAMVDLGLHQDPPKGTPMPKAKLELRRRLYHCVYNLDRSTSLVQTRAFSFSDDSAKVKVPFNKPSSSAPTSPAPTSSSQGLWPQSYNCAAELINLRKLQSEWYTDLFQSDRTRWEEPYQYLWNTCDKMRQWFDKLPSTTPPNMRAFFELDLLYSFVYVLSPSPRVPSVHPFAQKLTFEYCIRYADLMLRLISDPAYVAPLTFYDAMRVYMAGRQFLHVLHHNTEGFLAGHVPPRPDVKPTTSPPPPVPAMTLQPGESVVRANIVRSLQCIEQITECLSRFGIRWGYMSWTQRYQSETSAMLEDLNSRLRELDGPARSQSMWHRGSTGSMGSGHAASMSHGSPQSIGDSVGPYQQLSPPLQPAPALAHAQVPLQSSPPPQFFQPQSGQQESPPLAHCHLQFAQPMPPTHQQFHPPAYTFHQADTPHGQQQPFYFVQSHQAHPTAQFSNWGGYGGAGGNPSTLDEENAVTVLRQIHGHPHPQPQTTGSTGWYPASGGTRADAARSPSSLLPVLSRPKGTVLPPLTGTGPVSRRASRRNAMRNSAVDFQDLPPLLPYATAPRLLEPSTKPPTARPEDSGETSHTADDSTNPVGTSLLRGPSLGRR